MFLSPIVSLAVLVVSHRNISAKIGLYIQVQNCFLYPMILGRDFEIVSSESSSAITDRNAKTPHQSSDILLQKMFLSVNKSVRSMIRSGSMINMSNGSVRCVESDFLYGISIHQSILTDYLYSYPVTPS